MTEETEGSYLAQRVRAKCVEEGDCLIWQGTTDHSKKWPRILIDGKQVSIREALWVEKHGPLEPGRRVGIKCKTRLCVAEDCLVARTRAQEMKGVTMSNVTRAKISKVVRARVGKLEAVADEIRGSSLSQEALAQRFGVAKKTISNLKRGITYREYGGNPFAGLVARA